MLFTIPLMIVVMFLSLCFLRVYGRLLKLAKVSKKKREIFEWIRAYSGAIIIILLYIKFGTS
jgi:di/tricarboxylate transporter